MRAASGLYSLSATCLVLTSHGASRRGKHQQKHYTVYVASVSEEERAAYVPELNHEHSEWKVCLGPAAVMLLQHRAELRLTVWCSGGT